MSLKLRRSRLRRFVRVVVVDTPPVRILLKETVDTLIAYVERLKVKRPGSRSRVGTSYRHKYVSLL